MSACPGAAPDLSVQRTQFARIQWMVFGIVILAYMMSFFHRVAPVALGSYLQADFSATSTELGWIAAMYFVTVMAMQIPTGIIVDTLGPRKMLVLGCLIATVGSMVFASAETIPVACFGRALIGAGVAVPFVALLKLNASWFAPRQFATLSGLTILFGNLGSMLSTYPLTLVAEYVGWRPVVTGSGVLTLGLCILIWVIVRDTPAAAGVSSAVTGFKEPSRRSASVHWADQLMIVVRNPATWPCFWVGFGICGTFFTFSSLWAVPFLLKTYGVSKDLAATYVLAMLVSHAVTAICIGKLSDKLGNRKTLLLGLALLYVVMWGPMLSDAMRQPWFGLAVFAIQGIGSTSYTLIWALAKEANPPESAGMAVGVVNTSMFLATAILQPSIGWLIDRNPDHGVLLGLGLLALISAAGLIAGMRAVETHAQNIFPQRT